MACLTWRTLQSQVFILHFNQHFSMPWSERRKTTHENWLQPVWTQRLWNGEGEELLDFLAWPEWHMNAVGVSILGLHNIPISHRYRAKCAIYINISSICAIWIPHRRKFSTILAARWNKKGREMMEGDDNGMGDIKIDQGCSCSDE